MAIYAESAADVELLRVLPRGAADGLHRCVEVMYTVKLRGWFVVRSLGFFVFFYLSRASSSTHRAGREGCQVLRQGPDSAEVSSVALPRANERVLATDASRSTEHISR